MQSSRGFEPKCSDPNISVNDYRFTGKAWDGDARLFYFNARRYDPDIGRFISEDPLWGNILDPQSLNRFAYGRNNPFRYKDPTGKNPIAIAAILALTEAAEIVGGVCGGLIIGGAIGEFISDLILSEGDEDGDSHPKLPWKGPEDTIAHRPGDKIRVYGSDGYPEKDIDLSHDHGQGVPHVHDVDRPEDGTRPFDEHRKKGRAPTQEEQDLVDQLENRGSGDDSSDDNDESSSQDDELLK